MDKPDYFRATNLAYEILARDELSLPINLFKILTHFDTLIVISYSEMAKRFNMTYWEYLQIAPSEYGFLQRSSSNPWQAYIIYNDKKDKKTVRFTIAHELGHYVLEHTEDDDLSNKEANCFARNLLCPIPVAFNFRLEKPNEYMAAFAVSAPMAKISIEHSKSDLHYISMHLFQIVTNLAARCLFEQNGSYFNENYA